MTQHRFKQIAFIIGFVSLVYLVQRVGWSSLVDDFRRMGWFLVLILALSGIKYMVRSIAWAAAFFPQERQSWRNLFCYQLAGDALNYLSFAGPVLGEPAKASMLRGIRFAPALASTLLETTVNGITAMLVVMAGLALLALGDAPGNAIRYASPAAILVLAVLLTLGLGFLYALKCKIPVLTWCWDRLRHISWLSSPELGVNLKLIQERMWRLSSERPGALWLIFLLGFVTQALALLEVYAIVTPMGIALSLSGVIVLEAFTKLVKALFFFIPTRIGADEGSTAGIFVLLGFSPAAGLTLALTRRLRAIFWSICGLAVLLGYSWKSARANQKQNRRHEVMFFST